MADVDELHVCIHLQLFVAAKGLRLRETKEDCEVYIEYKRLVKALSRGGSKRKVGVILLSVCPPPALLRGFPLFCVTDLLLHHTLGTTSLSLTALRHVPLPACPTAPQGCEPRRPGPSGGGRRPLHALRAASRAVPHLSPARGPGRPLLHVRRAGEAAHATTYGSGPGSWYGWLVG